MYMENKQYLDDYIEELFGALDVDENGDLKTKELYQYLKSDKNSFILGKTLMSMKLFDLDGNGGLTFEEFDNLVRSTIACNSVCESGPRYNRNRFHHGNKYFRGKQQNAVINSLPKSDNVNYSISH
ncbi:hypothetical protein Ciccas_014131 [Cichlidogyrus casuarinus]|uniref:EF-hand domain-containing protein n=1 Tax=Cichlidogyrus casuarinus TaxID=1844966 RepID=A0ABD2PIW6_9PLAT